MIRLEIVAHIHAISNRGARKATPGYCSENHGPGCHISLVEIVWAFQPKLIWYGAQALVPPVRLGVAARTSMSERSISRGLSGPAVHQTPGIPTNCAVLLSIHLVCEEIV